MREPKVVRVEIERDDGSILRLTGEEARKWQEMVAGQTTLAHVHGAEYPELRWERWVRATKD